MTDRWRGLRPVTVDREFLDQSSIPHRAQTLSLDLIVEQFDQPRRQFLGIGYEGVPRLSLDDHLDHTDAGEPLTAFGRTTRSITIIANGSGPTEPP